MKDFDLITFDCYGTLIDWEAGISEAFRKEAAKDGIDLKHKEVVAAYATAEAEVEGKEFVPYHRVLCEAAHFCAPTLGWELTEQRAA